MASIRQWGLIDHDGKRTKRENEHYFTTNADRIRCAAFKKRSHQIASGSVESACKQYGRARLKLPGMRWKTPGIKAIPHLQSAILNRRASTILQAAAKAA